MEEQESQIAEAARQSALSPSPSSHDDYDGVAEADVRDDADPYPPAIDHLGSLVEAALLPDRCKCLRCAYAWQPLPGNPHPRGCPFCHSAYWDRPPRRRTARRPWQSRDTLERSRKLQVATNRIRRRGKRLIKLAAEFGIELEDRFPRDGGPALAPKGKKKRGRPPANPPAPVESGVVVAGTPLPPPTLAETLRARAYAPTVPPPPPIEDES